MQRSQQGRGYAGDEPDEKLAALAQQKDDAAYALLISRYVSLVKSRAFGYRDSDVEPEDLAQEGMIGLMMAIRSYRSGLGASFRTYAGLCIDRAIISAVRATMRAKAIPSASMVPIEHLEESGYSLPAGLQDDPEAAVLAAEERNRLQERFAHLLSKLELDALLLYLGGCSYEEIARRLDSTPKAIDNALQRVRRKLKRNC